MDLLAELDQRIRQASAEEVPLLLGRLAELEARARLRLREIEAGPRTAASPADAGDGDLISLARAAEIVGVTEQWLRRETRGKPFRKDIHRQAVRFNETGLRRWMAGRRG